MTTFRFPYEMASISTPSPPRAQGQKTHLALRPETRVLGMALSDVMESVVLDLYMRLFIDPEAIASGDPQRLQRADRVGTHEVEMRGGSRRAMQILWGAAVDELRLHDRGGAHACIFDLRRPIATPIEDDLELFRRYLAAAEGGTGLVHITVSESLDGKRQVLWKGTRQSAHERLRRVARDAMARAWRRRKATERHRGSALAVKSR